MFSSWITRAPKVVSILIVAVFVESKCAHNDSCYMDFPSSFAVLVSTGLNGHQRNVYSSRFPKHKCEEYQIWDPFNKQCRRVYCKTNVEAHTPQCGENLIEKPMGDDDQPLLMFLDSQSAFVNVTMEFQTDVMNPKRWVQENWFRIVKQFDKALSSKWNISMERIQNITVEYTESDHFQIKFLLKDDWTRDDILRVISEEIANQTETYEILNQTISAIKIHSILAEVTDFCMNETDMPIWYWNSDIVFETRHNLTYLHVIQTGRIYGPGEFMGNILYVQNETSKHIFDVSSNAVVCEKTLIDSNCPRILLNRFEYEFINGTELFSHNHSYDQYELTDNQSIYVCLKFHHKPNINLIVESILSTALLLISIVLLTFVLVAFVHSGDYRTTVNAFNMLHLVACLEIWQITFLASQFVDKCHISAVMFHFFILTTISWSSVIAFDLYRVFGRSKLTRVHHSRTRLYYSLFAYLLPLAVITISNLGDIYDIEPIKADYGPMGHSNVCWMRKRLATILYFIVPVAIAMTVNFILYIRIVASIRKSIGTFLIGPKLVRISSTSSEKSTASILSTDSVKPNYGQVSIYVKLSVPLGFTWILALINFLIPIHCVLMARLMTYLFIIANTSQGVVLFLAFGIYKKILCQCRQQPRL